MAAVVVVLGALLVAALPHGEAFNLHPTPHRVLTHGGADAFGHQVLQLRDHRVVVGAPQAGEGGRLFQCWVGPGTCREVELEANLTLSHVGLALARDDASSAVAACGPGLTRSCQRNVLTSGLCLLLDPQLRPRRVLTPGFQGCEPGLVDLVFLFDGSNSMSPAQFGAIRDFMVDVMEKLQNSSIAFGAVQFSDDVRPQFSLADFAARPRPRELFRGLEQLRGLTDTFKAIQYVVDTTFSPANGARPGARRVLILITDGDATDSDNGAVQRADAADITRYVIGVGNNFGSPDTSLYLSQFASSPRDDFVKVLEGFEKLRDLFQELQAKIYDIEGTSDLNRFHLEMCSSGLSVAAADGRWVTGAVGADNWAGGLVELEGDERNETFVASPTLEENVTDAYLGYSVATLKVPGRTMMAAGAPRHLHVGSVVLFELPEAPGSWKVLQTLHGEQVGSYFGATLLGLEEAGGGVALLVGVPNYYDGRHGGRVMVYRWEEDTLNLTQELRGFPGHPIGRFGAALTSLGDLDGDTYPDVAVGAPMENDDRGAVYVFSGRPGGLNPDPSQRLEGSDPSWRFFGRTLDGAMDLTGDGLADLAVGLEGHVVVLRSRPVLRLRPRLSFSPPRVPPPGDGCDGAIGVTVTLCLPGAALSAVLLVLEAEPERARPRAGLGGEGQRRWEGLLPAGEGPACAQRLLSVTPCPEDAVTPIRLVATFALPHGDPLAPVLPPNSPPLWGELPFERRCGADEVCEADLGVRALPGGTVVVGHGESDDLGVALEVTNYGEDAYGAALQVTLPEGLAFRRARAWKGSTPVQVSCRDPQAGAVGQPWGLSCNLSHPVLRAGWQVRVELTLPVIPDAPWNGSAVGLSASVSCDNEPHGLLGNNTATWELPVSFAVGLVVSWQDDSTPYVNFSAHDPRPKRVLHRYRLESLLAPPPGAPRPMVTVLALLPHELPHGATLGGARLEREPGVSCVAVGQEEEEADAVGQELRRSLAETCPSPRLRLFRCPAAPLPPRPAHFRLEAELRPPTSGHAPPAATWRFCSALWARLAPPPHFRLRAPNFLRATGRTAVDWLPAEAPPLGLYAGGGAAGLLLLLLLALLLAKVGFFRRSRPRGEGPEGEGPEGEGEGQEGEGQEGEEGEAPPPPN